MPYGDLRSFLLDLEARGELRRVRAEVDPKFEINEIVQRVVAQEGPALLFERVKGSRFPLAINFLGSFRRIEMALGMHPEELGQRILDFAESLNPPSPGALWNARDLAPRLLSYRPRRAWRPPCQQVVDRKPDLGELPIITSWPEDGGPFITFPLVITRHPVTGKSNLGIYRMHVYDNTTTGMHWQIQKGGGFHYREAEKRNQPLRLAVSLGADPALMLSGIFPLPEGFEEVAFAGILRARATRLARARTIDVNVPATSEFVLEGHVPPRERRLEGPFGDHFGHYCDAADFPVFHVDTITRRQNAIYPAAVVGKPPQEDRYMGDASQMIMGPLIKLIRPEVRDVWAYYQAGFHNLLVASVEGRYTKEPVRSALGILGEGQLGLSKVLVMVDQDVDARSFPAVLRAIRDHFDPRENFLLIPRAPLDTLDFTSFKMHLGSRMVLDATGSRAQYSGGGPETATPSGGRSVTPLARDPKTISKRIQRWRLWEDTLLAVQVDSDESGVGAAVVETLVKDPALSGVKIVAAVSADVDLDDDVDLIWGIFTRFDPARDLRFTEARLTGVQPDYSGVMGIDATFKPGYPGVTVMDPDVVKRVDNRWNEYWR